LRADKVDALLRWRMPAATMGVRIFDAMSIKIPVMFRGFNGAEG